MKNLFLKYTFIPFITLFTVSCSSDDNGSLDTTKPEINLISPKNEAHFHLGDDINIEAILKDNIELGNVKVDIHSAGDGHHHKSTKESWGYSEIIQIPSKREYTFNYKINIPQDININGHYHLGLILIDKAGNQTTSYIEIEIADHDHNH